MQPKKQKSQRPPQPFAFRGITSKSTPSRYPSASLPRRKTSFDRFTMLSTTFTWSRLQTSSMTESKVGEATPVRPHSRSHSSRAHRGGLRHVIQLIVELPPAVCPARTLNAEGRGVPDGRPLRVDAAVENLPIRQEQDEPLHGLEALSLDPKPTVRPR